MKKRQQQLYRDIAFRVAKMSRCERKKVGCVIVKDDNIISFGWNGTPSGTDNCCEDEHGKTKPTVIHAERNAIAKLARGYDSGKGAAAFITCSPCLDCAVLMDAAGIESVYIAEHYECSTQQRTGISGTEHLESRGIKVFYFPLEEQQ